MENEEMTDVELEAEETTETAEVVDDGKSEFEYDEEGNVIVPDVSTEEEDSEEDIEIDLNDDEEETEEGDTETGEEETKPAEETPSTNQEPEKKTETQEPVTERERALQAKIEALERQARDTLKKLGVKDGYASPLEGLQKVAAESSDMTLEEYKKKAEEEQTLAEAQNLIRQQKFAQLKAADLSELKKAFPHLSEVNDLEKIDNFLEFAKLRDKGLTPKQAYVAANPDEAYNRAESYNKAKARNDSKAHLRSAVPVSAKDNSIRMSKSQLQEWRDLFPDLGDKEIAKLYAKTKN